MSRPGQYVDDDLSYRKAVGLLWRDRRVYVPVGTIKNWIGAAEKNLLAH